MDHAFEIALLEGEASPQTPDSKIQRLKVGIDTHDAKARYD